MKSFKFLMRLRAAAVFGRGALRTEFRQEAKNHGSL